MSETLARHDEHRMYRETPVSRPPTMRETGVSRYIFKGGDAWQNTRKLNRGIFFVGLSTFFKEDGL